MSVPADREAALLTIYESLPHIDCQRLCHGSCGPIVMSGFEWARLTSAHGERACGDDLVCPHLERVSGLCGAYEVRPLICRLWGATERLRCEFGCEPDRVLSDAEVEELVERIEALSPVSPRSVWAGWARYLDTAGGPITAAGRP